MKTLKTLIVDDDNDFAAGLADLISACGHDATVLPTVSQAIRRFRDQPFDVAFVDIKMPSLGGIDMHYALKDFRLNGELLLMTALDLEEVLRRVVRQGGGAVSTLVKPYKGDDLRGAVHSALPDGIVLVFDNSPAAAAAIGRELTAGGYEVSIVQSEPEAGAAARADRHDLLVLDFERPVVTAIDAYLTTRKEGNVQPVVILVKRYPEARPRSELLRSRAVTGMLFKPFDVEEILATIRTRAKTGLN